MKIILILVLLYPLYPTIAAGQLVSREQDADFRLGLPWVDDPETERFFRDPDTHFYTDREMPPAYQNDFAEDHGERFVHSLHYNPSADGLEMATGPGNPHEFPWKRPGGLDNCDNVRSYTFFRLPRGSDGRYWPVVWGTKHIPFLGALGETHVWVFPAGTMFGECHQIEGNDGAFYTFEVRIRKRDINDWMVDIFRPFPTADDLATRIRELRPNWQHDQRLAQQLMQIGRVSTGKLMTLTDDKHPRRAFSVTAGVDVLPDLDSQLVKELLSTTPFQSCLQRFWKHDGPQQYVFAPTSQQPFNVVPGGYLGNFIGYDKESCVQCHSTTTQHVRSFDRPRDWYGCVPGSDEIFSWHPFDPSCISTNGEDLPIRFNSYFLRQGMFEKFDPTKHPSTIYAQIVRGNSQQ